MVYRVGSGTGSLLNTGNSVFLDEYTTGGALVQSIALNDTGASVKLVASGTASSEGMLTVSPDGTMLALTGYNSTLPGSGSLSGVTGLGRTVATVDPAGSVSYYGFANAAFASGNNPRGAVANSSGIYMVGGSGGLVYAPIQLTDCWWSK